MLGGGRQNALPLLGGSFLGPLPNASSINDSLPTSGRVWPSPRLDSIHLGFQNAFVPGRKLRLREGCGDPLRVQITQCGMVTGPWALSDVLSGVGCLCLEKAEQV